MSSVFGWPILLWVCTCVCVGVCVCVCVLYLRFQVTHCLVTWWANNVIVSDGNASNRVINCIRSPLIWFGFICFIHCFLPRGSRKNSSIFYVVSPSYRTSIKSSITGAKFDLLWHGSNFFFFISYWIYWNWIEWLLTGNERQIHNGHGLDQPSIFSKKTFDPSFLDDLWVSAFAFHEPTTSSILFE